MTQADLSQVLGVSQKTVSAWENDVSEAPKTLVSTALAIRGVNLKWLETGEGPMLRKPAELVKAAFREELSDDTAALQDSAVRPMKKAGLAEMASAYEVQFARDFARIPLLNVRASAGPGNDVGEEREIVKMAFRTEWLRRELRTSNPEEDFRLISAEGDSMEPAILGGDILLVDLRQKTVGSGGVYVIRQGDALSVKRLQRTPSGKIRIISDNPRYESFEVDENDGRGFELKGRVVWLGRKI
ncbi:MAG: LexA family transcriptional regulator [Deltaproteobacteria bacterium]|nr:LexA family transcriptional regulator [Deltaproteobacteria bacterium]